MAQRWDAARAASRRPLRKPYKPFGPMGDQSHLALVDMNEIAGRMKYNPDHPGRGALDYTACKCGYIVCSCRPEFVADLRPSGLNSVARGPSRRCLLHGFDGCLGRPEKAHVICHPDAVERVNKMLLAHSCASSHQITVAQGYPCNKVAVGWNDPITLKTEVRQPNIDAYGF